MFWKCRLTIYQVPTQLQTTHMLKRTDKRSVNRGSAGMVISVTLPIAYDVSERQKSKQVRRI